MNPGDKVYLKLAGHWTLFLFQRRHDEFGEACTVWNGNGDQQCKVSELITEAQFKEMERERERPHAMARLQPVIDMWEAGHRTGKAMTAVKGGHHIGWTAKIQAAQRWGFIITPPEYPQQPYEPSATDQPDVQ